MRTLFSNDAIGRVIRRLCAEICERHHGARDLGLIAIHRGGDVLAKRLVDQIFEVEGLRVPLGTVDITMYRDDAATAHPNPKISRSDVRFDVQGKTLIMVDDVVCTGRTVRAAIDAVLDYGRPRSIEFLALLDRGHRELPIAPNYVGTVLTMLDSEYVDVHLGADPSDDIVTVIERK